MRIALISILLFVSFGLNAANQDSLCLLIFNKAYNQHYTEAENLLQKHSSEIDALHTTVLDIDLHYWKFVTGTENPDYKSFEAKLETYNTDSATQFTQKVEQLVCLSYQLRYALKRMKLFAALSTRKKTKALFENLLAAKTELQPEHRELFQLYKGLFDYFDNYLSSVFSSESENKCHDALQNIESVVQSNNQITQTLARYFLAKTYLKYEKEPQKALAHFNWLTRHYPENSAFIRLKKEAEEKCK